MEYNVHTCDPVIASYYYSSSLSLTLIVQYLDQSAGCQLTLLVSQLQTKALYTLTQQVILNSELNCVVPCTVVKHQDLLDTSVILPF